MRRTKLEERLGANLPRGTRQVTLFIPEKDQDGKPIDQNRWVEDALAMLGELFRGATAFPPGEGVWRDDEKGGRLLREKTVMVTSYTNPADHTDAALEALRAFLHRFGREARQGEVGLVIDDQYLGITRYETGPSRRKGRGRR